MNRETFNEAMDLNERIQDLSSRIELICNSNLIIFESGMNRFTTTSGDFGFKEAKEAAIKKIEHEKVRLERKFDDL